MSNLTISIDEEVLKRARMRELEQASTVNAMLREFLEAYAGVNQGQSAAARDLDGTTSDKQQTARALLQRGNNTGRVLRSTRVLQEFFVASTRTLVVPLGIEQAERAVRKAALQSGAGSPAIN